MKFSKNRTERTPPPPAPNSMTKNNIPFIQKNSIIPPTTKETIWTQPSSIFGEKDALWETSRSACSEGHSKICVSLKRWPPWRPAGNELHLDVYILLAYKHICKEQMLLLVMCSKLPAKITLVCLFPSCPVQRLPSECMCIRVVGEVSYDKK